MRISRIFVMVLLLFPSLATADSIFISDGDTHNIGSVSDNRYVLENGTLNLLPGAEVESLSAVGYWWPVAVNMTGGTVDHGISVDIGTLSVSGGQAYGYSSSASGGDALEDLSGTTTISGGTFIGGDSPGQAGSGVVGSAGSYNGVPNMATLHISGGTFQGGTGSGGYYGGSTGYSLISIGNATITGGHFLSPIAINTEYGGVTDFLGTNLSYHDHILSGTLQDGDPINVRVYPDIADAGASVNSTGTEIRFGASISTPPPVDPPAIPEPSTVLAWGAVLAIGGLATARRKRTSRPREAHPLCRAKPEAMQGQIDLPTPI